MVMSSFQGKSGSHSTRSEGVSGWKVVCDTCECSRALLSMEIKRAANFSISDLVKCCRK